MRESPSSMIEVSLLLPRRIWTVIQRYAQEVSQQSATQGERPEADPAWMAAMLLAQLVENEEIIRWLGRSQN